MGTTYLSSCDHRRRAATAGTRQALTEARPELGEAASKATKAQQSAAILRNNAQRLRDCFENGRKLQVPLVDPAKWDPDK